MEGAVVFDIGGTYIRSGVYEKNAGLRNVVREKVPNFLESDLSLCELQNLLIDRICKTALDFRKKSGSRLNIDKLGIGFPGPIGEEGCILKAPSLWGDINTQYPLKQRLKERMSDLQIHVVNDLTASIWRYIDLFNGTYCLFTIGSGVGCKVMRNREVLLNRNGYGGEIGHHIWGVDYCDVECDCGKKGHIAGISSGRGFLRINRILRERYHCLFEASIIGTIEDLTTVDLVSAIESGDEYALLLLREGIKPIAHSISSLYAFVGIDRYIIMGGFAHAVGQRYLSILKEELRKMRMFGINDAVDEMVILGEDDDYNGLIGMGRYLYEGLKEE